MKLHHFSETYIRTITSARCKKLSACLEKHFLILGISLLISSKAMPQTHVGKRSESRDHFLRRIPNFILLRYSSTYYRYMCTHVCSDSLVQPTQQVLEVRQCMHLSAVQDHPITEGLTAVRYPLETNTHHYSLLRCTEE